MRRSLQRKLGHSSLETTNHCAHFALDQKAAVQERGAPLVKFDNKPQIVDSATRRCVYCL